MGWFSETNWHEKLLYSKFKKQTANDYYALYGLCSEAYAQKSDDQCHDKRIYFFNHDNTKFSIEAFFVNSENSISAYFPVICFIIRYIGPIFKGNFEYFINTTYVPRNANEDDTREQIIEVAKHEYDLYMYSKKHDPADHHITIKDVHELVSFNLSDSDLPNELLSKTFEEIDTETYDRYLQYCSNKKFDENETPITFCHKDKVFTVRDFYNRFLGTNDDIVYGSDTCLITVSDDAGNDYYYYISSIFVDINVSDTTKRDIIIECIKTLYDEYVSSMSEETPEEEPEEESEDEPCKVFQSDNRNVVKLNDAIADKINEAVFSTFVDECVHLGKVLDIDDLSRFIDLVDMTKDNYNTCNNICISIDQSEFGNTDKDDQSECRYVVFILEGKTLSRTEFYCFVSYNYSDTYECYAVCLGIEEVPGINDSKTKWANIAIKAIEKLDINKHREDIDGGIY